jgi:hypothetical protein
MTVLMDGSTNASGITIKAVNDSGAGSQPALCLANGSGNAIAKIVGDNGTGYLSIQTGTSNTERLRIDSSGNVGVGTASPTAKLTVFGTGSTASSPSTSSLLGATLALTADSAAVAGHGGMVMFGVNVGHFAAIKGSLVDGGTNTTGNLLFCTRNAAADSTLTERLRIDSSGNLIISGNKSLISNGAGGIASNTSIGSSALANNTTGYQNTANGVNALNSNGNGYNNTASGFQALINNTTGYQNTANGVNALASNNTGHSNTANGSSALFYSTTGYYNTASGLNALYSNTTGYNNTASGVLALFSNTTGYQNIASGVQALYSNTTGVNNTAIGFSAGYGVGTYSNTTGANNTFIGNESVGASATASNVITLGNGSIATLRCQVTSITSLSDKRDKKDIENLSAGLDFVGKLRPVSFVWNTRDKAKINIPDAGFIAQELLDVQEATGITIPNLVSQENPEKLEAAYGTLIPVLVQAIKELKAKVELLEEKNK